jgi:hypothetical protein
MPTRAVQRNDAADRLARHVPMRRSSANEHVWSNQAASIEDAHCCAHHKRRLARLKADIAVSRPAHTHEMVDTADPTLLTV